MIRKKSLVGLLLMIVLVCTAIGTVSATQGWDRTDLSFTVGSVSASAWNSCSDGTKPYYAPGHCVTTSTNTNARLKIEVEGKYESYGLFEYTVGEVYDNYCSEADGAGLATLFIHSRHYVNGTYQALFSSIL